MDQRVQLNFLSMAVVLALGAGVSLVTSTVVAARAYEARGQQSVRESRTITVKGSARTRIRSDLGVWRINVSGGGERLQDAYAVLADGVDKVRQFLLGQGFKPAEIWLSAIETTPIYRPDKEGRPTSEIMKYQLGQTIGVTTPELDRVSESAGLVTQLIKDGVFVVSQVPEYFYSKLPELKVTIMGDASRDARARAEEIATNAGCRVLDVRDARMGVLQITKPFSTEVADYGLYDTTTIDKDVQAVVTATFGIGGG